MLALWPALGMVLRVSGLPSADALTIEHKEVGCVVAGKFPKVTAQLVPVDVVGQARVYFRATGSMHWYFVEMRREADLFAGVLPKPNRALKSLDYYVEAVDRKASASRTAEYRPDVVGAAVECRREAPAALALSTAKLVVGSAAGAPPLPLGFASSGVTAAGGTAGTGAAGASGATGAGVSTGVVIAGVVGAGAAVAGAVVATQGGDQTTSPTTTAPGATTPAPTTTTLPAPSLTATWTGNRPSDGMVLNFAGCGLCLTAPRTETGDVVLTLSQSGTTLSGNLTLTISEAPPLSCPTEPGCSVLGRLGDVIRGSVTGSVSGTSVTMQWLVMAGNSPVLNLTGTVAGNRMSGTATSGVNFPSAMGTWSVNRQ